MLISCLLVLSVTLHAQPLPSQQEVLARMVLTNDYLMKKPLDTRGVLRRIDGFV